MTEPSKRTYAVATNTDNAVAAPVLTVTVRAAFFVPTRYLPPMISAPAPPVRGCETWKYSPDYHAVLGVTFEISTAPVVAGKAVELRQLDGETKRGRDTGIAGQVLPWGEIAELKPSATPARSNGRRHLGEAELSLAGLTKGDWVLKLTPKQDADDNQLTTPDEAACPATRIPIMSGDAGSKPQVKGDTGAGAERRRTYRPLHVLLTLDDELHLTDAVTVNLDEHGHVIRHIVRTLPDAAGGKKTRKVERDITHGYVTAHTADELAIDMKPDVIRSQIWGRYPRKAEAIDMIVIHNTAGPDPEADVVMGGAINHATVLKTPDPVNNKYGLPFASHYYIDRDGHVVKFLDDLETSFHTDRTHFYLMEKGKWADNTWHRMGKGLPGGNERSVGVDVVIKPGDSCYPVQLQALLDLLSQLRAEFGVKGHRVVGHCEMKVEGGDDAPHMGDRWNCPGVGFQWPELEKAGFAWKTRAKELGVGDYAGFFTLTDEDLAPLGKKAPPAAELALKAGDDDAKRIWGGVPWTSDSARAVLETRTDRFREALRSFGLPGVELAAASYQPQPIIKELQTDLRDIGYSVGDDGKMSPRTMSALFHFMAHTFSGPMQSDPPPKGAPPSRRRVVSVSAETTVLVDKTVASYLKGTAEAVREAVGAHK